MTYKAGELIYYGHDHTDACNDESGEPWNCTYLKEHPEGEGDPYSINSIARLPHSCGEWEIGGVDEVTQLILDLITVRRRMLGKPLAELSEYGHLLDVVLDEAETRRQRINDLEARDGKSARA